MPFWGASGSGKALAVGPYYAPMPIVGVNIMKSRNKIPRTNIFIQKKPAHNIWSIAPMTSEIPQSCIAGMITGTIRMVGFVFALFAFTVIACAGFVIRWLGLTLQNICNCIGVYLKMDQTKVLVLAA